MPAAALSRIIVNRASLSSAREAGLRFGLRSITESDWSFGLSPELTIIAWLTSSEREVEDWGELSEEAAARGSIGGGDAMDDLFE